MILTRGQAELRGEREGGEAKRKLKTVRAIETRLGLAHHCPDDRSYRDVDHWCSSLSLSMLIFLAIWHQSDPSLARSKCSLIHNIQSSGWLNSYKVTILKERSGLIDLGNDIFVVNWSTSKFCIYNLVSVNTFLCHSKKYLVLFTKTVIMISRKDYQNQNDFHPGIYLQSKNFSFTTKWPFTHWKFIDFSEFQTWPDRYR